MSRCSVAWMSRCWVGPWCRNGQSASASASMPVYLSDVSPPLRDLPRIDRLITDGGGRGLCHRLCHRLSSQRRAKKYMSRSIFSIIITQTFFFTFFYLHIKFASSICIPFLLANAETIFIFYLFFFNAQTTYSTNNPSRSLGRLPRLRLRRRTRTPTQTTAATVCANNNTLNISSSNQAWQRPSPRSPSSRRSNLQPSARRRRRRVTTHRATTRRITETCERGRGTDTKTETRRATPARWRHSRRRRLRTPIPRRMRIRTRDIITTTHTRRP